MIDHLALGRHYGFPECCIQAFIKTIEEGGKPALERGLIDDSYVPCEKHMGGPGWESFEDITKRNS